MLKVSVTILILMVGFLVSRNLPYPFSSITFIASAVGGYCVVRHKPRRVILRFGHLTWTRKELTRHFMITGDTGTGKTTSGINPILFQLTKNEPDWGGIVFGVKNDEHEFVDKLFRHFGRENDIIAIKIRPSNASTKWKPPHRYNLLSDRTLPWMTHAKIVVDTAASIQGKRHHPFFRSMAQQALASAFELIDEHGLPVTLSRTYELLTAKDVAAQYIKPFRKKTATKKQQKLVQFFESNLTEVRAYEQKEGIQGTIQSYLGFMLTQDVEEVFSSDEPNTFSLGDLEKGGVLTLDIPQALPTERRYLQSFLKNLVAIKCLQRFDRPKK